MPETRPPDTVQGLLLPVGGDLLLLPSAAVIEIAPWASPETYSGAPAWVLGTTVWREHRLVVVSLGDGSMSHLTVGAQRAKLAIVAALSPDPGLDCYALACTGLPRPVSIDASRIASASAGAHERVFCSASVRVDGDEAYVPDLDALEGELLRAPGPWLEERVPEPGE